VTFDRLEPKRTAARLEAAYAGAAELHRAGLEFVHPSVPAEDGRSTVAVATGALSCTRWVDGVEEDSLDVPWTAEALRRLHTTAPPADLPRWQPVVAPDLPDALRLLTDRPWGPGPYAEPAHVAVRGRLGDLDRWTARYHQLAEVALDRPWVATHGEPDEGNQMRTATGRVIVDWESLKLSPAELDLRTLVSAGLAPPEVGADPEMLELFDLEWRLAEISEYAGWFAAAHTGTADDEIAFGGLIDELERPGVVW
jgi:spectinomycin phosphotransferase